MSSLILPRRLRELVGPRKQRGFIINPYAMAAGGGGTTLYDLIMADLATYGGRYFRHGEASGAVMINENGTNGSYVGSPSLAQPPLYTGGPTSFAATTGKYGNDSTAMSGATKMTLVTIVNPIALPGTYGGLISRDTGSGSGRVFHWRSTSAGAMEFVNVGYSTAYPAAGIFAAGVPVMVGVTLGNTSTDTLHMYKNGVQVAVNNMGVANWGQAGDPFQIGFMLEGFTANSYFSESAIIFGELSGARMAQYATAAGL